MTVFKFDGTVYAEPGFSIRHWKGDRVPRSGCHLRCPFPRNPAVDYHLPSDSAFLASDSKDGSFRNGIGSVTDKLRWLLESKNDALVSHIQTDRMRSMA